MRKTLYQQYLTLFYADEIGIFAQVLNNACIIRKRVEQGKIKNGCLLIYGTFGYVHLDKEISKIDISKKITKKQLFRLKSYFENFIEEQKNFINSIN